MATAINLVCNLGFEFGSDISSEVLLICVADWQQSAFEIGLKVSLDPHDQSASVKVKLRCKQKKDCS